MLQVSVFSEDRPRLMRLCQGLQSYMNRAKRNCKIVPVSSAESALATDFSNFRKSDFCLIDFSARKGALSLAMKLSTENPNCVWICVAADQEFLMELLVLRPSGYIPDPEDTTQCLQVIQRVEQFCRKREQQRYFSFKYEGEFKRIPYSDISYFESSAKKVTLVQYHSSVKYQFTAKLEDIQAQTPSSFLRCHQSFLVNMDRIRFFDVKNKVIIAMPNEEVLVSRRLFSEAKQIYEAYIAQTK